MKTRSKTTSIKNLLQRMFHQYKSDNNLIFTINELNQEEVVNSLHGKMILVYGRIDRYGQKDGGIIYPLWINTNLESFNEEKVPQFSVSLPKFCREKDYPIRANYLVFGILEKKKQGGTFIRIKSEEYIYVEKKASS